MKEYKSIDDINKDFIKYLINREAEPDDPKLQSLVFDKGPIWYRGYFDKNQVTADTISEILDILDQDMIVVGHTSQDEITVVNDGLVIGIDCSIKLGKKAEGLLINDKGYFRCKQDGDRVTLKVAGQEKRASLFDHLYDSESMPLIDITTNVKRLFNKAEKEEYEASFSSISYDDRSFMLPTRVRARGNIRKKVCNYPPIKVDFKAGHLDSMGYDRSDKLKLVLPCDGKSYNQQRLYSEYFLYGLYQHIEPQGIRAKLAHVVLRNEDEVKKDVIGFLVEDEEQYALQHDAKVIEKGVVTEYALERSSFLKMCFFQYLISNTDWSISSKHNVELVKLPENKQVIALPYDFDYSGFVGQNYAVPHESLPIKSVHERYFVAREISDKEIDTMVTYYLGLEERLHNHIDEATYLSEKSKERHHKHFNEFYKMLRKPKSLKRQLRH